MVFLLKLNRQFFNYLIVGGFTALIYFLSLSFLIKYFQTSHYLGISISYLIAASCHFLLNRKYTFLASNQSLKLQIFRYLIMLIVNYLITLIVVWIVIDALRQSIYLGWITSIFVTLVVGFLFSKFWVFNNKGHQL